MLAFLFAAESFSMLAKFCSLCLKRIFPIKVCQEDEAEQEAQAVIQFHFLVASERILQLFFSLLNWQTMLMRIFKCCTSLVSPS